MWHCLFPIHFLTTIYTPSRTLQCLKSPPFLMFTSQLSYCIPGMPSDTQSTFSYVSCRCDVPDTKPPHIILHNDKPANVPTGWKGADPGLSFFRPSSHRRRVPLGRPSGPPRRRYAGHVLISRELFRRWRSRLSVVVPDDSPSFAHGDKAEIIKRRFTISSQVCRSRTYWYG